MKALDRYIQRRRFAQVAGWVPEGASVLDVGCADGALFGFLGTRVGRAVGVDGDPPETPAHPDASWDLRHGLFPAAVEAEAPFEVITMLAVVEHVPEEELRRWADAVPPLLVTGGCLLITAPSPAVDHLLEVGMRLRLIDGMHVHEHHGFDPGDVPALFERPGLRYVGRHRFQARLNNLFVFRRT